MLSFLFGLVFLIVLPLALGGSCIWGAVELVREAKKNAEHTSHGDASSARSTGHYPLAVIFATFGSLVLLVPALYLGLLLTWRWIED
jgi:hypothetical protein